MQQHIAPPRNVLGLRVLNLVVADAILAADEDHFGGGQFGHIDAASWPALVTAGMLE